MNSYSYNGGYMKEYDCLENVIHKDNIAIAKKNMLDEDVIFVIVLSEL